MKKFIVILSIACVILFVLSYKSTLALFTDTANSTGNTFAAADVFPTLTPTITPTPTITVTPSNIADHIVISEVQIDGGTGDANDNDFIELYNPSTSSASLNGMRLVKRTGSSPNDTNIFTFTSSHVIPARGFFLWANSGFAASISAEVSSSDTLAASNSIALRQGDLNTGVIIDALSWNSAAQSLKEGTEFSPDPGPNQSMERKANTSSTATSMSISGADEFKGNGFDTDNNSTDFALRTTSQPQNSSSAIETP